MSIHFLRTDSLNNHFKELVKLLDADLAIRDGADHAFYAQFNKIDLIQHVIVAYENEAPVGCGAFKKYDDTSAEIKRMYVLPQHRNKGIAASVLLQLEQWAKKRRLSINSFRNGIETTGSNPPVRKKRI
ncbi:MAG: GNAT family N-acetyltransferase [Chitinophagaceae bacterium]